MCRHTQGKDLVVKAELPKFLCMMAAMAIKDKQPPYTLGTHGTLMEVLDPVKANLVCCPSILTNSNPPVLWKASVPLALVKLAS